MNKLWKTRLKLREHRVLIARDQCDNVKRRRGNNVPILAWITVIYCGKAPFLGSADRGYLGSKFLGSHSGKRRCL